MITIVLLILNVGFSLYAMEKPDIKFKYIFHPYSIFHFKQHYRFLSHAFLHADYMHLAFKRLLEPHLVANDQYILQVARTVYFNIAAYDLYIVFKAHAA